MSVERRSNSRVWIALGGRSSAGGHTTWPPITTSYDVTVPGSRSSITTNA
jgi:hypothetical protein